MSTQAISESPIITEICEAIKNGEQVEKYEEWRHSYHKKIRQALAKAGYWPEQFIDDEEPIVRVAVLQKHPQYIGNVCTNVWCINGRLNTRYTPCERIGLRPKPQVLFE